VYMLVFFFEYFWEFRDSAVSCVRARALALSIFSTYPLVRMGSSHAILPILPHFLHTPRMKLVFRSINPLLMSVLLPLPCNAAFTARLPLFSTTSFFPTPAAETDFLAGWRPGQGGFRILTNIF
jgi:hypothetical protein